MQCFEESGRGRKTDKGRDRTTKKSRYIPKRLLARVEKIEAEKVSVEEILRFCGIKAKNNFKKAEITGDNGSIFETAKSTQLQYYGAEVFISFLAN